MQARIVNWDAAREHDTEEHCAIKELSNHGGDEAVSIARARVAPGDVVLIPAGAPQRIRNDGGSDLVFLAVCTPRFVPAAYEDAESSAL